MHFGIVVFIQVLGEQLMISVTLIAAVVGPTPRPIHTATRRQTCQPENVAAGASTSTLKTNPKQHSAKVFNNPNHKAMSIAYVLIRLQAR